MGSVAVVVDRVNNSTLPTTFSCLIVFSLLPVPCVACVCEKQKTEDSILPYAIGGENDMRGICDTVQYSTVTVQYGNESYTYMYIFMTFEY